MSRHFVYTELSTIQPSGSQQISLGAARLKIRNYWKATNDDGVLGDLCPHLRPRANHEVSRHFVYTELSTIQPSGSRQKSLGAARLKIRNYWKATLLPSQAIERQLGSSAAKSKPPGAPKTHTLLDISMMATTDRRDCPGMTRVNKRRRQDDNIFGFVALARPARSCLCHTRGSHTEQCNLTERCV